MLLCLHTVLVNCHSQDHIHLLQDKLKRPWVTNVNQICGIQSHLVKQEEYKIADNDETRNKRLEEKAIFPLRSNAQPPSLSDTDLPPFEWKSLAVT